MRYLFTILLCAITTITFCQRVKLRLGSLKPLARETSLNYEFSYDSLVIGDTTSEKTYLERKRKRYNEKEDGKGDEWVAQWYESRETVYQPLFMYYFGKTSGILGRNPDSKYTAVVKTKTTEPGWNWGVPTADAQVSGEVLIVETKDRSRTIAKIFFSHRSDNVGLDHEVINRIKEAYVNAAKLIGEYVQDKSGR